MQQHARCPKFRALYWYLFACVMICLFALGIGIYFYFYYAENAEKLEELREGYRRVQSSKKKDLKYLELQIEKQESSTYLYYVGYSLCAVLFFLAPFLTVFYHSVKEILSHCPDIGDCILLCPVLRYFSRFFESCSCSDENSADQIARDLSITYDREAPESVVFRGTRNTEDGAELETSGDLPGVPSTSNN